jgi:hypothetical protein
VVRSAVTAARAYSYMECRDKSQARFQKGRAAGADEHAVNRRAAVAVAALLGLSLSASVCAALTSGLPAWEVTRTFAAWRMHVGHGAITVREKARLDRLAGHESSGNPGKGVARKCTWREPGPCDLPGLGGEQRRLDPGPCTAACACA